MNIISSTSDSDRIGNELNFDIFCLDIRLLLIMYKLFVIVDIINFLLPAGLHALQPCRYCFYSVQKCFDKCEIWHGRVDQRQSGEIWRGGADLGVPPHAKFCKKNRLRRLAPYQNVHILTILAGL